MAKLKPEGPPGRANRKARGYTAEIVDLHDQGYTLAAIQQALKVEGVKVSRSTVHRELRRGLVEAGKRAPGAAAPAESRDVSVAKPAASSSPTQPDGTETTVRGQSRGGGGRASSMEQAEQFARSHVRNPLLKGNRK